MNSPDTGRAPALEVSQNELDLAQQVIDLLCAKASTHGSMLSALLITFLAVARVHTCTQDAAKAAEGVAQLLRTPSNKTTH